MYSQQWHQNEKSMQIMDFEVSRSEHNHCWRFSFVRQRSIGTIDRKYFHRQHKHTQYAFHDRWSISTAPPPLFSLHNRFCHFSPQNSHCHWWMCRNHLFLNAAPHKINQNNYGFIGQWPSTTYASDLAANANNSQIWLELCHGTLDIYPLWHWCRRHTEYYNVFDTLDFIES